MDKKSNPPVTQHPIEELLIGYRNHRGDCQIRSIIPSVVYFGRTEWHPQPSWLLRAYDSGKDANRDFQLGAFFGSPKIEGEKETLARIRAEARHLGYELVEIVR